MDAGDLTQMEPDLGGVLKRLPWFRDLSREHREEMVAEFVDRLVVNASRDEFTALLLAWSEVAHNDLKWSRFTLLRESGLLEPPRAA